MDGQQHRDWRAAMGDWSQAQAGMAHGVSKRAVADWEANITPINDNVASNCLLLKIARRVSPEDFAGDLEMAALFEMARARIAAADAMPGRGRPRNGDKIFADPAERAMIKFDDGSPPIRALTLQEAVIEFHHLPDERKGRAKIETARGRTFTHAEIDRLHSAASPKIKP